MTDNVTRGPEALNRALPPTWCAVECHDCLESWAVDAADFVPKLTTSDVWDMLGPLLAAHDNWHKQQEQLDGDT